MTQLQPEHNPMVRNPAHFRLSPTRELVHRVRTAFQRGPTPDIRLVDVSRWQAGPIDYAAMFDPADPNVIDGIVVKATEGTSIVDNLFTQHWQGAVSHAPVMVYHFFRGNLSGSAQAQHLLNTIQPLLDVQGATIVWCDIETSDGVSNSTRINRVRAFLGTVEDALGLDTAGMYSSPSLWSSLMTINGVPPAWTTDYWGWVAHWTSAPAPSLPAGWTDTMTALWQVGVWDDYPWIDPVPGISPRVDVNLGYFSDRDELAEWVGIEAEPPPPPPPPGCGCEEELAELAERILKLEQERIPLGVLLKRLETIVNRHTIEIAVLDQRVTDLENDPPPEPPPPSGDVWRVTDDKTLANYIRGYNNADPPGPYPIMAIRGEPGSPERLRWDNGAVLYSVGVPIRADGGTYWLQLKVGENGGNQVPDAPDLFIHFLDVTPI